MPFSKEYERKIITNYKEIVNDVNTSNIVDTMLVEDILTLDDIERINSKPTQSDKNKEFVRLLLKSSPKGYKVFIDALKGDEAYKELAEKIQNTEVTIETDKPRTLEDWIGEDLTLGKENKFLDKYLDDILLLQFSRVLKPSLIQVVATCLGMSAVDVDNAHYRHNHSPESMCHELLTKWRNRNGHNANVRCLLEKLFQAASIDPDCIDDDKTRSILREQILKSSMQDQKKY